MLWEEEFFQAVQATHPESVPEPEKEVGVGEEVLCTMVPPLIRLYGVMMHFEKHPLQEDFSTVDANAMHRMAVATAKAACATSFFWAALGTHCPAIILARVPAMGGVAFRKGWKVVVLPPPKRHLPIQWAFGADFS